jgi:hypothetical protein
VGFTVIQSPSVQKRSAWSVCWATSSSASGLDGFFPSFRFQIAATVTAIGDEKGLKGQ